MVDVVGRIREIEEALARLPNGYISKKPVSYTHLDVYKRQAKMSVVLIVVIDGCSEVDSVHDLSLIHIYGC